MVLIYYVFINLDMETQYQEVDKVYLSIMFIGNLYTYDAQRRGKQGIFIRPHIYSAIDKCSCLYEYFVQ